MTQVRRWLAALLIFTILLPALGAAADIRETPVGSILPRVEAPIAPSIGLNIPQAVPNVNILPDAVRDGSLPLAVVPSAIPAAQAAAPEAKPGSVAAVQQIVAPQLETIAKPQSRVEASAGAGANVQAILQGGKAAEVSGAPAVAGTAVQMSVPLAKNDGSKAAAPAASAAPAAPQAKAPKQVNSYLGYTLRRAALSFIAAHFGMVYSMPQATPALSQKILEKQARYADAVFSDIDDTLTKFNTKLGPEIAEEISNVRKAGKVFAAITDRPDYSKPGSSQMGALETMSAIPVEKRAGVITATNGGGKIYQYDAQGEPKLIYEEPKLPEEQRPLIADAAEAVKSQLAANGTAILESNPGGPGPYGHTMIFVGGTPEATVKKMAHAFEAELRKRGLDYEVEGRMAKDPSLPPYVTFSKLNKSLAVKRIIEVEKLQGVHALGMGDSMYAPVKPAELKGVKAKVAPLAARVGAWLSGGAMPLTGNRTDANMEHGNPGMLMLSVGTTGDPRMPNGYVLDGKGPEVSRRILVEVSRRRAGAQKPASAAETAGAIAVILLGLAAAAVTVYALAHGFSSWAVQAEQELQQQIPGNINGWPF